MNRRAFVAGVTAAGTAGLLGLRPDEGAAEPPPETTKLRLPQGASTCQAPQYVAAELLRGEGFSEVTYVRQPAGPGMYKALASGEVDVGSVFVAPFIRQVDAGEPVVILAGAHVGCLELFGTERVRTLRDLKGKTVAVAAEGAPGHVFVASMLAHVGLNPRQDVRWVAQSGMEAARLLADGKVDAYMSTPPEAQELRARKIGHVVVNTTVDRPWSQYFCCVVAANREFVRKHPAATKRALRAILKATDLCALEPERAARVLAGRGFTARADYTLQMMREIPYARWREYHPEDTVRFYALRLREAGMIKTSPQKILADGTDWRFLNELRKELKG